MNKRKSWSVYYYGVRVIRIFGFGVTPRIAKAAKRDILQKVFHITSEKRMKQFVLIEDY